jgi:hypothetical protein
MRKIPLDRSAVAEIGAHSSIHHPVMRRVDWL